MPQYPFHLIPPQGDTPLADKTPLASRPFVENRRSFEGDAPNFVAGEALADAMNTAVTLGDPLLITGEPGTGKTQAAYYAAFQLGVKCIHFQVKSDCTARDLLYEFDMVRYFRDAHSQNRDGNEPDKGEYIEKRALWHAFDDAKKDGYPQVLLIDEIDKAPRDFPNDLLHELDQMEFVIKETEDKIDAPPHLRPIVFITSNSERRLPEPFLRRCVYHHIEFDDDIVMRAVYSRRKDFSELGDDFLELAVKRFLQLRDRNLRKKPATGELLAWLRVLTMALDRPEDQVQEDMSKLPEDLSKLPLLGVLLKDHQDLEELGGMA